MFDSIEGKRFTFIHQNNIYTAYVVYYIDGDCSIEIETEDDPPAAAYDAAWEVAESLDLLTNDEYIGDGYDDER